MLLTCKQTEWVIAKDNHLSLVAVGDKIGALHVIQPVCCKVDHRDQYDNMVFGGDTLFQGSIGRTDFRKGSFEDLSNSIKTRLYSLSDDTIVYTGHGPVTTIGDEKRGNAFVRA